MAKLVMIGKCPSCGKVVQSRFPFELGECCCQGNPVQVPLKLAIVPAERHIRKLQEIAEFRNVSVKRLVKELLDYWL